MQPFSRETIIDRRQPALRWGAVFAGAAVAIATWMLLQLFGSGVALTALDVDRLDAVDGIGIGTTAWSVVALLIGMFLGGLLAGRLAGHHERRVAGLHGLLVWAASSIVGFAVVSASVAMTSSGWHGEAALITPDPGTRGEIERALDSANTRLRTEGKRELSANHVIEAARHAAMIDGYDRNRFIIELDQLTPLTRVEVERVVGDLGSRAPELIATSHQLGEQRAQAIAAANMAGCTFLVASLALALGLLVAVGGALLAARSLVRRRGLDADHPHSTAPYPIPPIPPDTD